MRSLCLLREAHAELFPGDDLVAEDDGRRRQPQRSLVTVDTDTTTVYCAVNSTSTFCTIYSIGSDNNVAEFATLPNPDLDLSGSCEVVGLQYLPELQALCLALGGGDLVVIRNEGSVEPQHEVMGSIDAGILCMEWSPDQELVVIITGTGTLLEMTKDFEVITEVPIHVEATGEASHVSVGWGRKETQFHGSEGKHAALRKDEPAPGTARLSSDDDLRPRLSWRGDGQYFACSAVDPNGEKRVIRVYDRECALQYTSENVAQLEHGLNWRPSGNLIASSQKLPHRHDIVFFEKNGLRHGEFQLRSSDAVVVDMAWNADSSVLAIWLESRGAAGEDLSSSVQLWTMNNYYWYLKQEIRPRSTDKVSGFAWDPENALRVHVLTSKGSYLRYDYCTDQFVSSSLNHENPATVAVIDGASVLLTPFKHLNVPPPMSALKVTLPAPAAHVSFGPGNAGDDLVVLLCDYTVQLYSSASLRKPVKTPQLVGSTRLPTAHGESYRQIAWISSHVIATIAYNAETNEDSVAIFDLNSTTYELASRKTAKVIHGSRSLCRLQYNILLQTLLVEAVDGKTAQVSIDSDEPSILFREGFPTQCPWISAVQLRPPTGTPTRLFIGLSERNKLYAGDRLISSDCTSFFVHNDFLILTTFTHTARFISLHVSPEDFKLPEISSSPFDEHIRRVERGSKIVIAAPADVSLVLQMPRGNLETVYPRALVLAAVRQALDRKDYKTAFIQCRKHRIDMNLIVDHGSTAFTENVLEFVKQVEDPEFLNLFISGLRDEDVTITMYAGSSAAAATPVKHVPRGTVRPGAMVGKVNKICDTTRQALETVDPKRYLQSILTTDVKKSPPDLETAMQRIMQVKKQESSEAADVALKYVIFLADVDKLYDVALGMYDFPLTLMVAQHSQKDPREYLPFLSGLQKLEPHYQRYMIDDHLGKRAKALGHLSLAGEQYYKDCLAYMDKHNLYNAAMTIYRDQDVKYRQVVKLYADEMAQRSEWENAGLLYEMAGDKKEAMKAYQEALMWQETMATAREVGFSEQEIANIAVELADEMTRRLQYRDAARVLLDHAKRPVAAIKTLAKGSLWAEASRTAYLLDLPNLVDEVIKPRVLEACTQLLEEIKEMSADLTKRHDRLRRFRIEKAKALATLSDPSSEANDPSLDNIDMFSDTTSMATTRITAYTGYTSSVGSRATARTARTAKARRKMERKRATGRDKAFEDEYLMNCIKTLMERSNAMRPDVLALVRALARYDRQEDAVAMQTQFAALVRRFEDALPDVFPDVGATNAVPVGAPGETTEQFKHRFMDAAAKDLDAGGDGVLGDAVAQQTHVLPARPTLSDAPFSMAILG
ncbi:IKI3 family-domain-containing protein [Fimicolochytrium jonesii]|uniref:IKI3 family-domain-containing protein n=1 Tax=Fimicolochytrium jonesii TaxID=1396493 RepID=UPI0022FE9FBA|nr:IKI3 family-domain-containing protein [Fimicolochytrium jonesii]KAI8827292.1 IKI3 family-domain-containing protein [Fimicolochytrium jonesii]